MKITQSQIYVIPHVRKTVHAKIKKEEIRGGLLGWCK